MKFKYSTPLAYLALSILAALLMLVVIAPHFYNEVFPFDSGEYIQLSLTFQKPPLFFWSPLRTYGYPLFLGVIRAVFSPVTNWIAAVRIVQFVLHIVTSLAAAGIFKRLATSNGCVPPPWLTILVYGLVVLNLLLLPLTQELLTDSLSVCLLTLFLYAILGTRRRSSVLAGVVLGLAVLVRPFYLNYMVGLLIIAAVWHLLINIRRWRQILSRALVEKIVLALAPFLLVISSQIVLVYQVERRLALTGSQAGLYIPFHAVQGFYQYKFEAYIGNDEAARMNYVSADRQSLLEESQPDSPLALASLMAADAPGTLTMILMKTVGMFQTYGWSFYRTTLTNRPLHPTLIYGSFLFFGFIYLIQEFLFHLKERLWEGITPANFMFLAIMLHILIYSVLVPESRFIAPIFPVLTALTTYRLWTEEKPQLLPFTILVCIVLYAVAYHVITSSLIIVPLT